MKNRQRKRLEGNSCLVIIHCYARDLTDSPIVDIDYDKSVRTNEKREENNLEVFEVVGWRNANRRAATGENTVDSPILDSFCSLRLGKFILLICFSLLNFLSIAVIFPRNHLIWKYHHNQKSLSVSLTMNTGCKQLVSYELNHLENDYNQLTSHGTNLVARGWRQGTGSYQVLGAYLYVFPSFLPIHYWLVELLSKNSTG